MSSMTEHVYSGRLPMKVTITLGTVELDATGHMDDVAVNLDLDVDEETFERLKFIVGKHDNDISYDCSLSLSLEPVETRKQ